MLVGVGLYLYSTSGASWSVTFTFGFKVESTPYAQFTLRCVEILNAYGASDRLSALISWLPCHFPLCTSLL
jgi:hypothetical protein